MERTEAARLSGVSCVGTEVVHGRVINTGAWEHAKALSLFTTLTHHGVWFCTRRDGATHARYRVEKNSTQHYYCSTHASLLQKTHRSADGCRKPV